MLVSMTGYGYGEAESDHVRIQVELKSVNNRFVDVQLRVPREYMALEPRIVSLVRESYQRGRIEVHVRRTELRMREARVAINKKLAKQYVEQLVSLKQELNLTGEITLPLLMSLEGMTAPVEDERDPEQDWPTLKAAVSNALVSASQMRLKEGEALRQDLLQRQNTLESLYGQMVQHSATTTEHLQQRLMQRVNDALARAGAGEIDQGRLLQEVVYYVDKVDISEELTRFHSHLMQLAELFTVKEAVGRKIDFLLQELVREANTIGSKTSAPEVSRCGMLIKVELEKIREQSQNIE